VRISRIRTNTRPDRALSPRKIACASYTLSARIGRLDAKPGLSDKEAGATGERRAFRCLPVQEERRDPRQRGDTNCTAVGSHLGMPARYRQIGQNEVRVARAPHDAWLALDEEQSPSAVRAAPVDDEK